MKTDPSPREAVLDLGLLFRLLIRNSKAILAWTLLGGILCLGLTFAFAKPQYQSSTVFYVSDAQAVENLENSFVVVLKMRQTLMEVLRTADSPRNHLQLADMVRGAALQDTHFFRVVVTGPDPYEARDLAEALGQVLPQRMGQIMEGTKTKVADEPILETDPCSPSYPTSVLLGCLMGLCAGLFRVLLQAMLPPGRKS